MGKISNTLTELLPDLLIDQRFNSAAGAKRIQKKTDQLLELAHEVNLDSMPTGENKRPSGGDYDPTLRFVAEDLDDKIKSAQKALQEGNRHYARSLLRSVTDNCITCHSRGNYGPKLKFNLSGDVIKSLQPWELANLQAALRLYDQAFASYEKVLKSDSIQSSNPFQWENSVLKSLVLAIRIDQDPKRAKKIVDQVLRKIDKESPFAQDARAWEKSIDNWIKEPQAKSHTEQGLYAMAQNRVAAAQKIQQYPADRAGLVEYLRATTIIHQLLRKNPSPEIAAKALFLNGVSYEGNLGLDQWSLHQNYFEACIRMQPHTSIANSCYHRLEDSVKLGYSGSLGMSLPASVQKRLKNLRSLAKVKK